MAVTIAVSNQKGGVGKTTTTLNLAVGLVKTGYRVLAVDLDPQYNLTLGLQVDTDLPAERTVAALFQRGGGLASLIVRTAETNLKVVPASIRLAAAAENCYGVLFREVKLQEALPAIADDFDYIILDCPPNLGVLAVNGLVAAEKILIPTPPSTLALSGLADLLVTLQTVKGESADWRILLTRVSGHGLDRLEAAERILAPFAERVLETHIHQTEGIERSQMRDDERLSAAVLDRPSANRGARDYWSLVKEIETVWPAR